MALTTYSIGTVTVANGSTTVTGVGTSWIGKVFDGDLFTDPAQGIFARVTADATTNTSMAINAWPGLNMTAAAYEVLLQSDSIRTSERTRQLLEQMSVVQANGRGLFYRFSDTTTDADPGSGYLRLNNATIGSATAAYIDNLDANGATVSAVLDSWDDEATAAARGQLWLRSVADPAAFHAFRVTGTVVDGTSYRKLTLTYIGGSGSFAADDELMVAFSAQGADGTNAILGVWQGAWVTATAYDVDDLVEESGSTYICIEAHTAGTFATDLAAAKWELAIAQGDTGPTGAQGEKGWSPQIVVVSDGTRRVHQLAGYVGGTGSAPTANVGDYLKGDGTFTATIGDAADVRGPAGLNGAGTVASIVAGDGIAVDSGDPTAPVISVDPTALVPPRGHLSGLTLTNNVTDAEHDLDIANGEASSDAATPMRMVLASAITKRFDATFVEGTTNGGFASGESLPTSGTIHIWLITKADGTTDVFANNHATSALAPTLPSGFTHKRRIASWTVDASANLDPVVQNGNFFNRKSPANSINVTDPGTSAVLRALSVPLGLKVMARLSLYVEEASSPGNNAVYASDPSVNDATPSLAAFSIFASILNNGVASGALDVVTNTSGQIRIRQTRSNGNIILRGVTHGWFDDRRA